MRIKTKEGGRGKKRKDRRTMSQWKVNVSPWFQSVDLYPASDVAAESRLPRWWLTSVLLDLWNNFTCFTANKPHQFKKLLGSRSWGNCEGKRSNSLPESFYLYLFVTVQIWPGIFIASRFIYWLRTRPSKCVPVWEECLEKTVYYETGKTIYWHAIIKSLGHIWVAFISRFPNIFALSFLPPFTSFIFLFSLPPFMRLCLSCILTVLKLHDGKSASSGLNLQLSVIRKNVWRKLGIRCNTLYPALWCLVK